MQQQLVGKYHSAEGYNMAPCAPQSRFKRYTLLPHATAHGSATRKQANI